MWNRKIYILVFVFFSFTQVFLWAIYPAYSQNLVPNPSFENLKGFPSCWTSGGKEDFESLIYDWTLPNNGTTDLLSTLVDPSCITAIPESTYPPVDWFPSGSQLPRSGNTVAGIKPLPETRREYLKVKLICPLVPGTEYYAEMYVSLAEKTNYAQNALGMYFSLTDVYEDTTGMLFFTPQVVEDDIIEDTVNWVKVSGTFIASGPAEYLIIGNFAGAAQTQVKFLGNKSNINFPYYYIDDVSVQKVTAPALTVSGDSEVCPGEALGLSASGWTDLRWYSMSNALLSVGQNFAIVPPVSASYIVRGKDCNWQLADTIEVTVHPAPMLELGNDTLICQGTVLELNPGAGFASYEWQDGSVSQLYPASLEGIYKVNVSNSFGCYRSDSLTIGYYKSPAINIGADEQTCNPEGTLHASTGQTGDTYEWQDGSRTSSYKYGIEGKYWVTVRNACGMEASDTITIHKINMMLPNLITPNMDGKNEHFEISGVEIAKGSLSVYNIFGSKVFHSNAYSNDWSAGNLSDGIYFYEFAYPTCKARKGWLHVLR